MFPRPEIRQALPIPPIQALEDAGTAIFFDTGTFYVTGLTKNSNNWWVGEGAGNTIIQLADGANNDVVQGSGFSSLTAPAIPSDGGITFFGLEKLSIYGNASNQTLPNATPDLSVLIAGYNGDTSSDFNLPGPSTPTYTIFTLKLSSVEGMPASGAFTVMTDSGPASIDYTSITSLTLTLNGCTTNSQGRVQLGTAIYTRVAMGCESTGSIMTFATSRSTIAWPTAFGASGLAAILTTTAAKWSRGL